MFFLFKMIAHATVWAFAGPYLITFVLPVPIFVQVAAWLNKWELRKPPPKIMATCWGLAMSVFVGGINSAIFYYGVKFGVIEPDLGGFAFIVGFLALTAGVGMYFQILQTLAARRRATPT
jgi:hypothetical protein